MRPLDGFVKSWKTLFSVIPAEAGHVVPLFKPSGATSSAIQAFQMLTDGLDSGFDRSDDFLRSRQSSFMILADRYLDRIDFLKYLPRTDCAACGAQTCGEFVDGLKGGVKRPRDCPDIPEGLYYPLEIALDGDDILPKFPCVTDPRPGPTGVVEINGPDRSSSVLVSGNHVHTQDVLTSVLSTTSSPFCLLFTDTKGNTVDMAVIFKTLTAGQIRKDLETSGVLDRTPHQDIILPGLARAVGDELIKSTGWDVVVGPICAAELPLFLADIWLPPLRKR